MTLHPDESRSAQTLLKQRAAELLSDPETLVRKYEGLAARERRNAKKIAKLEKELKATAKTASKQKKSLTEQTKTLGSARAAIDAYREENRRLKDDLKRVRGSSSMKLGKAVLAPMHSAKNLFNFNGKQPEDRPAAPGTISAQTESPSAARGPETEGKPVDSSPVLWNEDGARTTDTAATGQTDSSERLSELEKAFHESGSAGDFAKLLNYQWYVKGMVFEPARLLTEHNDVCLGLDEKTSILAGRILGAAAMSNAHELIPEKSTGAAYTPERDRVVYCAHSTPTYNSNGYSTRTRGIVAGLARAGIDVTVVARAGYPWDSAVDKAKPEHIRHVSELDGVQYVHLPGANLNTTPLDRYTIQAADALVREAKLLRPSIIHAASNFRNALPALIAARRIGVPFVYEVRGLWEITEASTKVGWSDSERYQLMAQLEALVAMEADAVLAITQEVADELIARGVPAEKIRLAPNSVDSNAFLPLPADEHYAATRKIRTDAPVIGFAGSLVEYEGLDTLLDAAKILTERGRDFQVVIAGSGSHTDVLKKKRDEEGISNVTFTGRVPIAEVPRLYSLFDIMPCPRKSLPVTEMVSPLKPLEAFASGKAVVLSDVSPHRTLSGNAEERALLFPAGDAVELAKVLERLIVDHELRDELGRRGRRWVRTSRSWSGLGTSISGWYREARALYRRSSAAEARSLDQLTVGIIADEFTSKTLAGSVKPVLLDRRDWKSQLSNAGLDAVFIESAWEGNGGQWHRGVGYYGEEDNKDLFELIANCRTLGIPTIFWNKEDPIHFNRFRLTAARCDYVFTTDADMVVPYLSTEWAQTKVSASLPFYAQPKIHNPLPGRILYDESAAYAGTYYGDRYKERSKTLTSLLSAAKPYGLSIYDRQLAFPGSPYRFPREFASEVRGVLPYDTVLDSYKAHVAQLNVNSVEGSPSMYSRRVVEIPACGGVVLSGPGRGITETFGTAIPATDDARNWRALLHSWTTDPVARTAESWLQYRSVMRSHTVDTELTIMFRIAGIPVTGRDLDSYSIQLPPGLDESLDGVVESLVGQSVLPDAVFADAQLQRVRELFAGTGVRVEDSCRIDSASTRWIGQLSAPVSRTHFEDMLYASRFGDWTRISVRQAGSRDRGSTIARTIRQTTSRQGLILTSNVDLTKDLTSQLAVSTGAIVEWIFPVSNVEVVAGSTSPSDPVPQPHTVVVAGHDLKFADQIIEELKLAGHRVLIDKWDSHTSHDEEASRQMLERADTIFCEWGLGNAVWYSKRKRPHQRLVVRVHSQELRRPYLGDMTTANVNAFVFVGELIKQAAITSHNVPASKSIVIPNFVDNEGLKKPKQANAEKNIGLVGIIPQSKRMDRALDILEQLLERDSEYRLFIKGKRPEDYPWLKNRPDEIAYYEAQYARAERLNEKFPGAVTFDEFSPDMTEWYQKIGIALSVSDFESFHFTIPDGAASGAVPYCLAWPGADLLYPDEWIFDSVDDVARAIGDTQPGNRDDDQLIVAARYNGRDSAAQLRSTIIGDSA